MTSYDFYPFVEPTNVGKIVFPNFNTLMEDEEVDILSSMMAETKIEEVPKKVDISDIEIDFEKVKLSRGRQTKTSKGYNQETLKGFGKQLKKRGFTIDFKSKDALIDSILLLE